MVCQGPYWQLRERMIKTELYVLPKLSLCSHRLSVNAPPATNLARAQATQQLRF